MRVDLPKGEHADLRDVDDVTERQRRPLMQAIDAARSDTPPSPELLAKAREGDEEAIATLVALSGSFMEDLDVIDAVVLALVSEWSFDAEISAEGLLDLPAKSLDRLRGAVAPFMDELTPNFAVTDNVGDALTEDGKPSPKGSGNSSDSKPGLAVVSP